MSVLKVQHFQLAFRLHFGLFSGSLNLSGWNVRYFEVTFQLSISKVWTRLNAFSFCYFPQNLKLSSKIGKQVFVHYFNRKNIAEKKSWRYFFSCPSLSLIPFCCFRLVKFPTVFAFLHFLNSIMCVLLIIVYLSCKWDSETRNELYYYSFLCIVH